MTKEADKVERKRPAEPTKDGRERKYDKSDKFGRWPVKQQEEKPKPPKK